jgi:hypothetical protein
MQKQWVESSREPNPQLLPTHCYGSFLLFGLQSSVNEDFSLFGNIATNH